MHLRLALLLIAVGCGKGASEQAAPGPRLFTDDELARFERGLQDRLAETAKRACPRPVVREPGTDGPAAADLVVLVEPTGTLVCLPEIGKLASSSSIEVGTLVETRAPRLLDLEAMCGDELEEAVRKAAAHRDACSPFQLGLRKDPDTWMNVMYGAHLLGLRARLSAERGTPAFALWMLLDGAAAFRDLGRGRVGLIGSMIAVASTDLLLEQARAILTVATLAPADLDALIAGVDALLASEPPFAETLAAERDYFELYYGMPPLKGTSWVPPGGWPDGTGPRSGSGDTGPFGTKPMTKHPRDEAGIMFAAAEGMAADRATACPATATLKACHEGLVTLGETAKSHDPKAIGEQLWTDLAKAVGSADTTATAHRIREAIVGVLESVAHPAFSQYAAKRAAGFARLAAFRLHLEILRQGHCPTEGELAGPPYPALRAPAALGDTLAVQTLAGGDLEVSPPAWAASNKPPWRISCKLR